MMSYQHRFPKPEKSAFPLAARRIVLSMPANVPSEKAGFVDAACDPFRHSRCLSRQVHELIRPRR
jgi:hypothetical protein